MPCYGRSRGFTLVELIVTMLVVSIMAVVVMPKLFGNSGFDEREFRDRVAAALRYAQKSAIAARRTTCASFTAAPATVTFMISNGFPAANCAVGAALVGPDGTPLVVTPRGNVTFAAPTPNIIFDAAGRPNAAATIAISGLPAALDIIVEAETGYVH